MKSVREVGTGHVKSSESCSREARLFLSLLLALMSSLFSRNERSGLIFFLTELIFSYLIFSKGKSLIISEFGLSSDNLIFFPRLNQTPRPSSSESLTYESYAKDSSDFYASDMHIKLVLLDKDDASFRFHY